MTGNGLKYSFDDAFIQSHFNIANNMLAWFSTSVTLILFLIDETSGSGGIYQIQSTKTVYESFTDKMFVNASVSKVKGLSLYINIVEDFNELFTDVSIVVDLNDNNDYDFDVVRRTINTCKLFKEPTYEPVIQFLYKLFVENGNFPTDCPIKKGLYYLKDMKVDPKNLPEMMSEKKAILSVKHLSKKSNEKMKLLAYYEVHFAVLRVRAINATVNAQTRPRKPNRQRTP